jgi:hypothetical protein
MGRIYEALALMVNDLKGSAEHRRDEGNKNKETVHISFALELEIL